MNIFIDPVLRAPMIGCMLMGFAAGLVGVFAYLRKESLLGETLSHAAYPGVMIGVLIAGFFSLDIAVFVLLGAFIAALLGVYAVHLLKTKCALSSDASLCFVLSVFFGIGVTLASRVQFTHSALYQQSLVYLYGQAATMTDKHIAIYACLSLVAVAILVLFFKELGILCFDREYALSLGVRVKEIETLFFSLIALAIVVGIRSVGVVLISALLIAPAVAARQYTDHLRSLFILSGFFGLLSGFLGNLLSSFVTSVVLPTGPMIVLVASGICIFSLLFAPKRGWIVRGVRIFRFRDRRLLENILKSLWRSDHEKGLSLKEISEDQLISSLYLKFLLFRLINRSQVVKEGSRYVLTKEGLSKSAHIVRLHRLWELYLVSSLKAPAEKVHANAEEMEHIITPEIEKELTDLLDDPKVDPHHQPIPPPSP